MSAGSGESDPFFDSFGDSDAKDRKWSRADKKENRIKLPWDRPAALSPSADDSITGAKSLDIVIGLTILTSPIVATLYAGPKWGAAFAVPVALLLVIGSQGKT